VFKVRLTCHLFYSLAHSRIDAQQQGIQSSRSPSDESTRNKKEMSRAGCYKRRGLDAWSIELTRSYDTDIAFQNSLDISHTLFLLADLERLEESDLKIEVSLEWWYHLLRERGDFEAANKTMKEVRRIKSAVTLFSSIIRELTSLLGKDSWERWTSVWCETSTSKQALRSISVSTRRPLHCIRDRFKYWKKEKDLIQR